MNFARLVVVLIATAVLVTSTIYRLRFGVDFTDEAFYAAMPLSFVSGNRPFVNEHVVQQTAAIVEMPLVQARLEIAGREGLILFLRYAWLALALLASAFVFVMLRRIVPSDAALLGALVPVSFIPFSIPSLSYNTISALLLTIGLSAAGASFFYPKVTSIIFLVVSGAALALGAFAYPPLVIVAMVSLITTFGLHFRADNRAAWTTVVVSGLTAAVAAWAYVDSVTVDAVKASISYNSAFGVQGGGLFKVAVLVWELVHSVPYSLLLRVSILLLVMFAIGTQGRSRAYCLALVPIVLSGYDQNDHWVGMHVAVVDAVALLAALVLMTNAHNVVLLTVWLPSLIAGAIYGWTSSNGLANAALGLIPALCVTISVLASSAAILGFLVLLLAVHIGAWRYVYRDDPIRLLNKVVAGGAYAGLRTTQGKAEFLQEISRDIAAASPGAQTILYYDNFPAGYLAAELRPLVPTTWIPVSTFYPRFDRAWYARWYREQNHWPDLIVEMRLLRNSQKDIVVYAGFADDPFRWFFWKRGYRMVTDGDAYTIYRRCIDCDAHFLEAEEFHGVLHGAQDRATLGGKGWGSYASATSGGRVALTQRSGAIMSATIPGFERGDYEVDIAFVSDGSGMNTFVLDLGGVVRKVTFSCGSGLHRMGNIVFRDVQQPKIAVRSGTVGQSSLTLDGFVIRRPQRARAVSAPVIESETLVGAGCAAYR